MQNMFPMLNVKKNNKLALCYVREWVLVRLSYPDRTGFNLVFIVHSRAPADTMEGEEKCLNQAIIIIPLLSEEKRINLLAIVNFLNEINKKLPRGTTGENRKSIRNAIKELKASHFGNEADQAKSNYFQRYAFEEGVLNKSFFLFQYVLR